MINKSILAIILVLVFCFASLTLFAAAEELEIKTLLLHYQPNPIFAAQSVAIKKGWFEEVGFERVETKSFTAGALAGEALIAGEIHVWVPGNMPVISMRHNGIPVVVAGMLNVCPAEYLMVRDDAGVTKPEDLYNIKIGLLVGSTASGVLEELATHHGLDINKIEVINLPPPEQVTSLRNNDIQAILVWPPARYQVEDIATYMFDNLQFSHTNVPMVFSEDFIRKYPNTAKAIMKVLYRAQAFCEDPANKDEAIQIHHEISEQPVEIIEQGWMDYWDPAVPNGYLDQRFVDDFQAYTDFQERNGRIKNPVSVLEYTYTGFLEEIKPEYVKVKGQWQP
jgi:ABC-type nitrate/sulfonate/bicarbonate transport system substrate-binding protein